MEEQALPVDTTPGKAEVEHNQCGAEWGNCTGDPVVQFGKPTATPHRCNGPKRHIRKLHRCGCGSHGHCVMPTALSRAGRETKQLMDLGDRMAGMAAARSASELAIVKARSAENAYRTRQELGLGESE